MLRDRRRDVRHAGQVPPLSSPDFIFETEFTLLDVGATGALIRSGGIRPTVVAYTQSLGAESVVLDWSGESDPLPAFEEARRWLRSLDPIAYAVVSLIERNGAQARFISANEEPPDSAMLALALFAADGQGRGALYPIKVADGVSLGPPTMTEVEDTDWCPIGDIWANPFCVGDVVRLKPRERALDPSSQLWKTLVDLTKMRIQADEYRSPDYMAFLDDLRNGIFAVAGRPRTGGLRVTLRPRTTYNPIGFITVDANKLVLVDSPEHVPDEGIYA